jgi:KRAB domain-containing zinc finger protein
LRHHSLICSKSNVNNLNCIDVPPPQKQAEVVTVVKNVEKEYKCLECGKIISNYQQCYNHKKMHEGIIYRCVQCPSTYKTMNGLKYHSKTAHVPRRFECHHCQTTFQTKNNLISHINSIEKEHKCLECGKSFSKYRNFYDHKKTHKGIIYRCVQCPSTYKLTQGLKHHSRTVHELRKFECHHCQTTFTVKVTMKRHMSLHFNSIVYPCNQCPAQFFKYAALLHHILICPNAVTDVKKVKKKYKCLECGKIFSNYQNFYKHKKKHEGIDC